MSVLHLTPAVSQQWPWELFGWDGEELLLLLAEQLLPSSQAFHNPGTLVGTMSSCKGKGWGPSSCWADLFISTLWKLGDVGNSTARSHTQHSISCASLPSHRWHRVVLNPNLLFSCF